MRTDRSRWLTASSDVQTVRRHSRLVGNDVKFMSAFVSVLLGSMVSQTVPVAAQSGGPLSAHQTFADLRWYGSAAQAQSGSSSGAPFAVPLPAGWRLIRTPDPRGGPDAVAVIHPGELTRSDADFAGLMIRCRNGVIEVLVVLIKSLSPRDGPQVSVQTPGGEPSRHTAAIAPPGAAVLLPEEVSRRALTTWPDAPEVAFAVLPNDKAPPIRGVVLLAGFSQALEALRISCASR